MDTQAKTLQQPNTRFSVLDLDESECYFSSINAVYFDKQHSGNFLYGFLHFNSRSVVFDADDHTYPLIKMRFNQNFNVECFSYDQLQNMTADISDRTKVPMNWRKTPTQSVSIGSITPRKKTKKTSQQVPAKAVGSRTAPKQASTDLQRWSSMPSFRKLNYRYEKGASPQIMPTGGPTESHFFPFGASSAKDV